MLFREFGFISRLDISIYYYPVSQAYHLEEISYSDSRVLHCASLLRTVFASLEHADEGVYVHNIRDFPQNKIDSKINAHFLLHKRVDIYFFIA